MIKVPVIHEKTTKARETATGLTVISTKTTITMSPKDLVTAKSADLIISDGNFYNLYFTEDIGTPGYIAAQLILSKEDANLLQIA